MRKAKFKQVELFVNNTYQLLKSNPESLSIEQTSSGLKYIIHEQGHGEQFESHETVEIHYYGLLLADGSLFDNSFEADLLFRFELGADQVIRGFNEGVALLRKGSKATLIIPYALAYGRKGDAPTIPKSADLIYYIEVPK